jgi:hypothetical protein
MSLPESSVDVAIAFIISSYNDSTSINNDSKDIQPSKSSKKAKNVNKLDNKTFNLNGFEASKNKSMGPVSEPLPNKGMISAEEFLKGLSNCGKRLNDKGILVYQGDIVKRNDEMRLVSSYLGWSRELHGVQLENARRVAQLAIKPVKALNVSHRGASASLSGFISGMPDNQQKLVQDLLAREQLSAKAIVDYENAIANSQVNSAKHILSKGLLIVEKERLIQIRKDLSLLDAI